MLQYSEKTVHRGTGRHDNYRDRGVGVGVGRCSHMRRVFSDGGCKVNDVLPMSRCYSTAGK